MPLVTAPSRVDQNKQSTTSFTDSVGTTSVVYSYSGQQDMFTVSNQGNAALTIAINGSSYSIQPGVTQTVNDPSAQFTIVAASGTQQFTVTSIASTVERVQVVDSNLQYQALITRQTDFAGKTVGQTWDVPHIFSAASWATSPQPPTNSSWVEAAYTSIMTQDGSVQANSVTTNGLTRGQRFQFDLLTVARRTPGISNAITVSDLRNGVLKSITPTWVGYGTGSNGGSSTAGAQVKLWNKTTGTYDSVGSNSTTSSSAVSFVITNFADYLDDNGMIHVLAHPTYASNGTIQSACYADYVKVDMVLQASFMNDTGITCTEEQQLTAVTITAGATTNAWSNIDTSRCEKYAVSIDTAVTHSYAVNAAAVGRDNVELDLAADRTSVIAQASQSKKRSSRIDVPARKVSIYISNSDVTDRTYFGRFFRYGVKGERLS